MDFIVRACISLCLCDIILTNSAAVNQHLVCKSVQELFTGPVPPSSRHDDERREVNIQGQPGKRGALGPRGYPGVRGLKGETGKVDCNNVSRMIEEKVGEELESIAEELNELRKNITNPTVYKSCLEIRRYSSSASNGIYSITDEEGSQYRTYCDMEIGGGGWTLIASVHENYMAGKCTTGDRWSSEHGNTAAHPHRDGAWENTRTFGRADSATSDDYKNPGYYNIKAKNVMIWHVPNNALLNEYSESFAQSTSREVHLRFVLELKSSLGMEMLNITVSAAPATMAKLMGIAEISLPKITAGTERAKRRPLLFR